VERLTPEQIRLLEELRELRDSGILTVDEFEFQVAKVLGRPLLVEPSPVNEEPVTPDETVAEEISDEARREEQDVVNGVPAASDETQEAELLEYEFVESATSDFTWLLVEENEFAEPPPISDTSALPIVETESQQNSASRRKILIGTTVSLILIVVIGLVTLVGGGKSDSKSSQIIDNTSIVTQSTTPVTTKAPTASTTTTTEAIPTTTFEVLECPYTRVIEAIDGKIVTPEGITFNLRPATYFLRLRDGRGNFREENGYQAGIEVENTTNFRLRIGMELEWSWPNGSLKVLWGPDNGRGWINGFDTRTIGVPDEVAYSQEPITDIQLKIVNATIKYLCP
jgi:cell division septation protein DedD